MRIRPCTSRFTLAAFAIGFVIGPATHLAFHDVPHDHEGGGVHERFGQAEAHDHHPDETDEHHREDHAPEHGEPFDPAHGRNSIGHLSGLNVTQLSMSADLILSGLVVIGLLQQDDPIREDTAFASATSVRGPPALT